MSQQGYNQQPYNPYEAYNEHQSEPYERPQFPHHTQATHVVLEESVFVPSGVYQPQFRRPWTADLNNDNLNQVYEAVHHAYHDFQIKQDSGAVAPDARYAIDPSTLAGVSGAFILPAAGGEALARLHLNQGGLHVQTCRFLLKLAVYRHGAAEPTRYLAVGYTGHMGIQLKHGRAGLNQSDFMIDPQTDMTINAMLEVREKVTDWGYGPMKSLEMVSVNQVLVDTQYDSVENPKVIRMRPYEVTATLSRRADPGLTGAVSATDTRIIQNAVPEYSDVHNSNPNDYMAKIISGLTAGRDEAARLNQNGVMQPYHNASRIVRDHSARNDPFFRALASFTDGIVSATFKWRDLLKVDPNAERDEICLINMRRFDQFQNKRGENMAVGTDTSAWNGRDLLTQWAVQITNILPPLMMDLGMRRVEIFAANIHRESICKATNAWPFMKGVNLTRELQLLDIQFYEQFIRPMSGDGRNHSYDIDIVADLYGEIVINISLNGSVRTPYVLPAFMNSAMTPVLTSRPDTLDSIASQFYDLQRAVLPAVNPLITDVVHAPSQTGRRY